MSLVQLVLGAIRLVNGARRLHRASSNNSQSSARGTNYRGPRVNGRPHGVGRMVYQDGSVYEGQFVHGQRQGKGQLRLVDGTAYQGDFHHNLFHGEGTMKWVSGSQYIGQWASGKRHGVGRFIFTNGAHYFGTFADNKKQGVGVYDYPVNGSYRIAQVNNDELHGIAYSIFPPYSTGVAQHQVCIYEEKYQNGQRLDRNKVNEIPPLFIQTLPPPIPTLIASRIKAQYRSEIQAFVQAQATAVPASASAPASSSSSSSSAPVTFVPGGATVFPAAAAAESVSFQPSNLPTVLVKDLRLASGVYTGPVLKASPTVPHGVNGRIVGAAFTYEGGFEKGCFHGPGKTTFDGGYRMGTYLKSKLHGYGTTVHTQFTYQGYFVDSKYNGHGELTTMGETPSKYIGSFRNGLKHGHGRIEWPTLQQLYVGEFQDGKRTGFGTFINNNPEKKLVVAQGHFVDGQLHGEGKVMTRSGWFYIGTTDKYKFQGTGTLINLTDGRWFKGQFEQSKCVLKLEQGVYTPEEVSEICHIDTDEIINDLMLTKHSGNDKEDEAQHNADLKELKEETTTSSTSTTASLTSSSASSASVLPLTAASSSASSISPSTSSSSSSSSGDDDESLGVELQSLNLSNTAPFKEWSSLRVLSYVESNLSSFISSDQVPIIIEQLREMTLDGAEIESLLSSASTKELKITQFVTSLGFQPTQAEALIDCLQSKLQQVASK